MQIEKKGWQCPTWLNCCFYGKDYETMTEVMDGLLHDTINVHKGELMEHKNQTEKHGYRSNEDKKCHG